MSAPEQSPPRVIVRTLTQTWAPVVGPLPCRCGHQHFGRRTSASQAPQWHICEDESCSCAVLRVAEADA